MKKENKKWEEIEKCILSEDWGGLSEQGAEFGDIVLTRLRDYLFNLSIFEYVVWKLGMFNEDGSKSAKTFE